MKAIGFIFWIFGSLLILVNFLVVFFATIMTVGTFLFLVVFIFDQIGVSPFGEIPPDWVTRPFVGAALGWFLVFIASGLSKWCMDLSDRCYAE